MTGVRRELRWALSRGAYDEENAWGAGLEVDVRSVASQLPSLLTSRLVVCSRP